jgi:hypothetical protein
MNFSMYAWQYPNRITYQFEKTKLPLSGALYCYCQGCFEAGPIYNSFQEANPRNPLRTRPIINC